MADGTQRAEKFTRSGNRLPINLSRINADTQADKIKLEFSRTAKVSLQALVNTANRIHDTGMRDAALGRIVKNQIRFIEESPSLMSQLSYQKADLLEIADMMHDPAKRESMKQRIQSAGSKK